MEKKEYLFQKLTPVNNAEIDVYEEAIDFAFDNTDVRNVAISGAYSAGKSSVLESYKAKHKDYRFVHLSLAHFRTPEQENNESEDIVKESVLEGKILNQLIHQIPSEKIPQTNFRVKKGVSNKQLIRLTIFTCLFIGSILFLLLSPKIVSFISALDENWIKPLLSVLFNQYAIILVAFICIACCVTFIFFLISAQKNKNVFRKINLQGNEIEFFKEQDDSYFDKYLNEVLYLFENVEADVIVFEDMDRFNASKIFERLREVNNLVNIQRKKEHDEKQKKSKTTEEYRPLRFFYLLRDDIFISKDRTKFFDYIVPIVPIVDSSNSYEQFLKHLKDGNLLEKFDQSFLQSLSLYVDDMRILKNIYNEFLIYIHRLNSTDLDYNKMMAMITYKNLFPRDFSDLQLAKGFVFTLFKQKDLLIEKSLESAKKEKQALIARIDLAKKEILISEKEIDAVYAAKYDDLPKDYYGHLNAEGQKIQQQYESECSKRKQAIQDIGDNNLSKIESQLSAINWDITLIQSKSLKNLISRNNVEEVFSACYTNEVNEVNDFKKIKSSDYFDLLKFLIWNGYIDETYTDYMTYFYEDSVSANDKTFLRRITDKRGAEFTYSLREPQKVIESPILRTVAFEQEETLNFDLFECLLLNDTKPKYAAYLKSLISQIRKNKRFDFLSQFYDMNKARSQCVIKINEQWSEFFSLVVQEQVLTSLQIRKFSIDTLYYSDDEVIRKVNCDDCLAEYISKHSDYLDIEQPDVNALVSGFLIIGVSFSKINYEKSNKALFAEVYNCGLYDLTFENISLMLEQEYKIDSQADIAHKNYSLIQSQPDSPLAKYVSGNIEQYVNNVLNNCNNYICDDEDVAISLLNNSDVEEGSKKRYIPLLSTTICDVTQVDETNLWPVLMSHGLLSFSESNFMNYFQQRGLDTVLINYLNSVSTQVDFSSVATDFGEEISTMLFDTVAISNSIETEKYKKILLDLNFSFNDFDAEEISDGKFTVLIVEGILQMDVESLHFVREKYVSHIYEFIQRNLDEYIALQTADIFRLEEALKILAWDIHYSKKIELLSFTNDPISIVGINYSDEVSAYIITNNLNEEDKQHLYTHYSQLGEMTRTAIATLAIATVGGIISDDVKLDDNLLSVMLQSNAITHSSKIALFTMAIPMLNKETCKTHFDELKLADLKGIFSKSGGRRNYEKSDDTTAVLEALKVNGWIYEYHDDERNSERYTVIKNRPRSKEPEFLD
ncbi:MAG: hypothetical protein RR063_09825 [Anaerovoracaceae bacterium]